jgi:hypothetical protein
LDFGSGANPFDDYDGSVADADEYDARDRDSDSYAAAAPVRGAAGGSGIGSGSGSGSGRDAAVEGDDVGGGKASSGSASFGPTVGPRDALSELGINF